MPALVGHGKSLFLAEVKSSIRRIVGHVAAGGLCAQPLAHITFGGRGALSEFRRSLWSAGSQGFISVELVADANQSRIEGGAKIDDGFAEKFMQLILMDGHGSDPRYSEKGEPDLNRIE
jgi:hypothetical protein